MTRSQTSENWCLPSKWEAPEGGGGSAAEPTEGREAQQCRQTGLGRDLVKALAASSVEKAGGGLSSEASLGHLWPFDMQDQLGLFISGDMRFVS